MTKVTLEITLPISYKKAAEMFKRDEEINLSELFAGRSAVCSTISIEPEPIFGPGPEAVGRTEPVTKLHLLGI